MCGRSRSIRRAGSTSWTGAANASWFWAGDGRFVRTLGRPGQGPGELGTPAGVTVTEDGRVVVGDAARPGIVSYSVDGADLGEMRFGMPVNYATLLPYPGGGVVMVPPRSRWSGSHVPLLRHSLAASSATEVLHEIPNPGGIATSRTSSGFQRVLPPTFSPAIHLARAGNAVAVAEGGGFDVTVLRDGQARQVGRDFRPRRVSEADRQAAREERRRRMEAATGGQVGGFQITKPDRAQIEAELESMRFAEELPVIQDLRGDPEGRLWVQRHGSVALGSGPVDVLAPDGSYLGTVDEWTLPTAFGPGGLAAWIQEDDFGVPIIVVRRITIG